MLLQGNIRVVLEIAAEDRTEEKHLMPAACIQTELLLSGILQGAAVESNQCSLQNTAPPLSKALHHFLYFVCPLSSPFRSNCKPRGENALMQALGCFPTHFLAHTSLCLLQNFSTAWDWHLEPAVVYAQLTKWCGQACFCRGFMDLCGKGAALLLPCTQLLLNHSIIKDRKDH